MTTYTSSISASEAETTFDEASGILLVGLSPSVTRPLHAAVPGVQTALRDFTPLPNPFGTGSHCESRLYRPLKNFFSRAVTFRRFATDSFSEGVKAPIANSKRRSTQMQNSKVGRQTVSQRVARPQVSILMSIVLFIALSMVPSSVVQAQVECLGVCEAQYAACIGRPGQSSPDCQDAYENCVNNCLGSFAALLG
jgi:hypothetical protein